MIDLSPLPWQQARIVPTKRGERQVRDCVIPGEYRARIADLHKTGELFRAGYTVSHVLGALTLTEWRLPDGSKPGTARFEPQLTAKALLSGQVGELTPAEAKRLAGILPLLLDWQPAAVKRSVVAVRKNGATLDASDMGTGKTYTVVATAYVLDLPLFVVCPKAVVSPWHKAAEHFGIELFAAINYEVIRTGQTLFLRMEERTFRNRPMKDFAWKLPANTIIAFDECQRLKDPKTSNARMGIAAFLQRYRLIGISATAADNPTQMKFAGLITGLFKHPAKFDEWCKKNGVYRTSKGLEFLGSKAHTKEQRERDKDKIINQIHCQIFPRRGTRVRIADIPNFPETQITAEAYDCGDATEGINAAYAEMEKEIAKLRSKENQDREKAIARTLEKDPYAKVNNIQAQAMVLALRAQMKSEFLKVPTLSELALDGAEEGKAVIIFTNFDDALLALVHRLDAKLFIRGGQTPEEREWMIEQFQQDKEPFILCNNKAGGVGVSLHAKLGGKERYSLICPTYSPIDLKQIFGRPRRAGGTRSFQRIIYAAGTIEEKICAKVRDKIKRIDTLNDGDLAPPHVF